LAAHFLLEKQVEARRFIYVANSLQDRVEAWLVVAFSAGGDGDEHLAHLPM